MVINDWLVVWNMAGLFFHHVGNGIIIPTDELTPSFFRGVGQQTTNQSLLTIINHH